MPYRTLADITVLIHLFWILFLIIGVIPGLRVKWIRITHIAGWCFSILLQIRGWYCPITHLEYWLRGKAGWTYSGTFIHHYVERMVYLDVSRVSVFIASLVVIVVSGGLYIYKLKIKKQ